MVSVFLHESYLFSIKFFFSLVSSVVIRVFHLALYIGVRVAELLPVSMFCLAIFMVLFGGCVFPIGHANAHCIVFFFLAVHCYYRFWVAHKSIIASI